MVSTKLDFHYKERVELLKWENPLVSVVIPHITEKKN